MSEVTAALPKLKFQPSYVIMDLHIVTVAGVLVWRGQGVSIVGWILGIILHTSSPESTLTDR